MSEERQTATGASCARCGSATGTLAPSGRCLPCETSMEPSASTPRGGLRQIGEVAEMVGLSLRTIRLYEDEQLVRPAGRTAGGFRLYDDDAIARLRLIMQMKPLGFTLQEMRLLIETRAELDEEATDEDRSDELRGRLGMYFELARDRVVQLTEHLALAEAFVASLEGDVARHPRPEPAPVSRPAPSGPTPLPTDAPPTHGRGAHRDG